MLFAPLLQLDIALFHFINNLPHGELFDLLTTWIRYGTRGGLIYLPLLIILLAKRVTRTQAIIALGACLGTTIVVDVILKPLVHRARPFSALHVINLVPPVPPSFSFPSGETAFAFAVAMICTLMFKNKWWKLLWLWAFLIGIDRIYMGHHYPSDVMAGALIGVIISYAAYHFTKAKLSN